MTGGRLIVVCGLPGTGKTTVGSAVAERTGADLLRTDVIRKDLIADPSYTDEEVLLVYGAMFDRARQRLERGETVVVDGTFQREAYRDGAFALADRLDADRRVIKVVCDDAVVRERILDRDGMSDADYQVYLEFKETWEPLAVDHDTVDNSGSIDRTRRQVATLVGRARTP